MLVNPCGGSAGARSPEDLVQRARCTSCLGALGRDYLQETWVVIDDEDGSWLFEPGEVSEAVGFTVQHAWGNPVRVVVPTSPVHGLDRSGAIRDWVESVRLAGAWDVAETARPAEWLRAPREKLAERNEATRRAREREALCAGNSGLGRWLWPARDDLPLLAEVSSPWLARTEDPGAGLLTLVRSGACDNGARLRGDAARWPASRHLCLVVGNTYEWDADLDGALRETSAMAVRCLSTLEAAFLVNALCRKPPDPPNGGVRHPSGEVEYVDLAASPAFTGRPTPGSPILVTSGFPPTDDVHLRAAAREVGAIARATLPTGRVVVLPGATPPALTRLLLGDLRGRDLAAWFHLGHGDPERGLQGADGRWLPVRAWLAGIRAAGRALGPAVFSSCDSAHAARILAEDGAGIGIGFEGNLNTSTAWMLTSTMVHAVDEAHDALLSAYATGLHALDSEIAAARPKAYMGRQ